jgi:hypothetical protein
VVGRTVVEGPLVRTLRTPDDPPQGRRPKGARPWKLTKKDRYVEEVFDKQAATELGNMADDVYGVKYPYQEVLLETGVPDVRVRVDSYGNGEIVSRKRPRLQLGDQGMEETALDYLQEHFTKYRSGMVIADTPANREQGFIRKKGKAVPTIKGRLVLEIPKQTLPIPERVLEYASQRKITIRDFEGNVYK